jgi:hypothetical protein
VISKFMQRDPNNNKFTILALGQKPEFWLIEAYEIYRAKSKAKTLFIRMLYDDYKL